MNPIGYRVSIDQPCNESWDAMAPAAGGRYCANCNKCVLDLSGLDDRELVRVLADAGDHACAKLRPDQLDRVLMPAPRPATRSALLPRIAAAVLFFAATRSYAQGRPLQKTATVQPCRTIALPQTDIARDPQQDSPKQLSGHVLDQFGSPIPGLTVLIPALKLAAATDSLGAYSFALPEELPTTYSLVIFFEGMTRLEVQVNQLEARKEIVMERPVSLTSLSGRVGGLSISSVQIISDDRPRFFQRCIDFIRGL